MRKPLLYLCMAACLAVFPQQILAGGMHIDQYGQGHNTPWGSYTETGRNTPWGSYSDTNRQDRNDQHDRQYDRNGRERHHDNQGYENCGYRQAPPQDRYENRMNTGCRSDNGRTDTMKSDTGRERRSDY